MITQLCKATREAQYSSIFHDATHVLSIAKKLNKNSIKKGTK
ncbi:hypothetical protein J500_2651 [Acinetobacter sp. 479375]|nr:hypothetical protein J500_2651 [Acinetobacter sp. 479375]